MKYNLKEIMSKARELYRRATLKLSRFGEALHRAWNWFKSKAENARRIAEAIKVFGITEEVKPWFEWTLEGRMVKHEEKALFHVLLLDPSKGDGKTFNKPFFGFSQTDLIENVPPKA